MEHLTIGSIRSSSPFPQFNQPSICLVDTQRAGPRLGNGCLRLACDILPVSRAILPYDILSSRICFSGFKSKTETMLPPGAWDTHVHIFDSSIGPFASTRAYTPGQATLPELMSFGAGLSATAKPPNFTVVQPSAYGTDNSVLLSTLRSLRDAGHSARGVAVVDLDNVTDLEMQDMHELGVRGLRLNMQFDGKAVDIPAFKRKLVATAERVARLPGWFVQTFISGQLWDGRPPLPYSYALSLTFESKDIYDTVLELPVPIIADHIGGLLGASKQHAAGPGGIKQRGYGSLLQLVRRGKVIVKISGLYRASDSGDSGYADLAPIVSDLASEVPDQLVWASDWPHTGEGANRAAAGIERIEPFRVIDNTGILCNLRSWVGNEESWIKMLVVNPARIYGTDHVQASQ
jgi:predicted TIM-barrel fold metal-dependent hydrolase